MTHACGSYYPLPGHQAIAACDEHVKYFGHLIIPFQCIFVAIMTISFPSLAWGSLQKFLNSSYHLVQEVVF